MRVYVSETRAKKLHPPFALRPLRPCVCVHVYMCFNVCVCKRKVGKKITAIRCLCTYVQRLQIAVIFAYVHVYLCVYFWTAIRCLCTYVLCLCTYVFCTYVLCTYVQRQRIAVIFFNVHVYLCVYSLTCSIYVSVCVHTDVPRSDLCTERSLSLLTLTSH